MGGAIRRHWPTIASVLLLVGVAIGFLATLRPVPPPPDLARDLHAEPPEALRDLQRSIGHWQAAATGERIAYLEWLTDTGLEDVRQQAKAHIRLRARNQQVETAYLINSIFSLFAALSLGVLLVPFFVSNSTRRLRTWAIGWSSMGRHSPEGMMWRR